MAVFGLMAGSWHPLCFSSQKSQRDGPGESRPPRTKGALRFSLSGTRGRRKRFWWGWATWLPGQMNGVQARKCSLAPSWAAEPEAEKVPLTKNAKPDILQGATCYHDVHQRNHPTRRPGAPAGHEFEGKWRAPPPDSVAGRTAFRDNLARQDPRHLPERAVP